MRKWRNISRRHKRDTTLIKRGIRRRHFLKRLKERYGLYLTINNVRGWERMIEKGFDNFKLIKLYNKKSKDGVYETIYNNKKIRVVYKRKTLVTAY